MKRKTVFILLGMITVIAPWLYISSGQKDADPYENWPTYGGNKEGSRYSHLDQINLDNVNQLKVAWEYDTGENKDTTRRGMDIQCQPIVIDGILYGTTPQLKLFAADAATGKEIWKFDPFANPDIKPRYHPVRGLVYWADDDDQRILYAVGASLYALNAKDGRPVTSFGQEGIIDLHLGLGTVEELGYDVNQFSIRSTSPGIIYKDLIIMGSALSEGGDALPGHIRAYNIRTGKLAWVFRTIPHPGEYGYDTWSEDAYRKLGGANCWAGMVLDEKRGMVFLGTGSPSVDFYGGARKGQNLFANCVIALNANTGERIWHFQTVHHDLWDRDIPCPPNLLQVKHNGRIIDAVAQATKDGYVFVFDRDTGEPLFRVNEEPAPEVSALPGEHPWPTQPVPEQPAPFALQSLSEDILTNRTPEARAYVLNKFNSSRSAGKNIPPSLQGSLIFGMGGGAEWGGAAVDPEGVFYVNGNNMLWWLQMRENPAYHTGNNESRGTTLFSVMCSACHERNKTAPERAQAFPNLTDVGKRLPATEIKNILISGRGRMPSFQHVSDKDLDEIVAFLLSSDYPEVKSNKIEITKETSREHESVQADFPYIPPYLNNGNIQFRDQDNYPAVKPPWGTLNAIDLNTGEYRWSVPLGEYPELTRQGISPTGTENHGGPLVTAGGLLFIAATYDQHLRAFDISTGKVVWKYKLPAGGFATPVTYKVEGKQYIAIAAGGTRYGLRSGSNYIAFALP